MCNVHRQLLDREKLDSYLSSALGVPLQDGRLQDIDDAKYVLTLDYTVKVHTAVPTFLCHVFQYYNFTDVKYS